MNRRVQVKIPDGLKGGDKFALNMNNRKIEVDVPPGYRGGQKLELEVNLYSEQEVQQYRAALANAGMGFVSPSAALL